MISFSQFEQNLQEVRHRIVAACAACGRQNEEVALLPVTKNHPIEAVLHAAKAGLQSVGENRVQEVLDKRGSYKGSVKWELIGHLQSNKAKDAVEVFDRIQSVDSLKLLRRLDRIAGELGKTLPILLQCNTGEDPNKFGFRVDDAASVLEAALACEHLIVDGLMTIAPLDDDPDISSGAFIRLRELRDRLRDEFGRPLDELSMGMTGDLEMAIAAGSTQIRVGTALYGARA